MSTRDGQHIARPTRLFSPHFAVRKIPGENSAVARGEQNSVFRAFRYAPEQVPWL